MKNQSIAFKESHIRSIIKGFSWRVIATLTTIIISYYIIGNIGSALEIGFLEFMLKIFIYYLHERLWLMKFFLNKSFK